MYPKHVFRTLLLIITAFFGLGRVSAQETTASLGGTVKTAKGSIIDGATISLRHEPTGFVSRAISNNKGYYFIGNLQPGGPYTISISYVGFGTEEKNNYYLSLGSNTLDQQLKELNNTLTEVTVAARSGGLKSGANVQVGQNQIRTIPSLNRSLQDVTKLTPQSNNNSFAGTNFRYNNVTIDGAINNDAIGFSPSLGGQTNASGQPGSSTRTNPVSLDAIQDVQVYLTPYDIKIGNFLGGSINAVTRSGSNELHGSVYGYGRSAFLIGPNNAGDKSKIPTDFHDYQTGVRLGFPIIKNKLFFFTNEEITRRVDPVILAAGSSDNTVISLAQAQSIDSVMRNKYGLANGAGAYGNTSIYSNSNKFFNRIDWVIDSRNRLSIRNNTIRSQATNLERDQQNFRFGSIDFKQVNNQTSTVAELKTNFHSGLSNSLVLGYSNIHDYREPASNPALPQIEIASSGGSTIFLGTDREGAVFNMKQKTYEFTDNLTMVKGNHTFTFGTHNEFYDITYGFVNSWNGRASYSSVSDFLNNKPNRVRTNYNYADNTRDYIMSNPPAAFHINLYSVYAQDEIRIGRLKLMPGLRADLAVMPNKQLLSSKTTNAPVDPNFGTTYAYTLPKDIRNDFLGQVQVSPRLGFNWDIKGNQQWVLRGGTGVFTGRIPFAWLGYAYYNNGVTYGAFDQRASTPYAAGSDPVKDAISGNIGEANFVKNQGRNINDPSGATQVDLIDNHFKMPQVWRSSLALDYTTADRWKFTLEGIYTKVIYDLKFQQVNYVDNPTYWVYDTKRQQPIYSGAKINPLYTNAYLLSNTKDGYRYSLTAQVNKSFHFGLGFTVAYTYGYSKDITNGIRNSMESNWQLNQSLSPNSPALAYSNFDIRHRIVSTANYRIDWNKQGKSISGFSLFFNTASGLPFSYGLINTTYNGTGQAQSLVYIPAKADLSKFFADPVQAANFDAYVDADKYLRTRRGDFTERNGGRTPWNTQLDFRFTQDINLRAGKKTHTLTFTYDIINLTNLLSSSWGKQYFSPNTFNSMASTGLKVTAPATAGAYPTYTWSNPSAPYSIDLFGSRYQMQAGLRYTF
ncbi:TonB-dependent receptor [Sediminibacterium soli]|uniref:TonB-dependent receptor n=1 Tax=Sediminibacterium soli TaxID=2698829 RepID=UPI0013798825|nr:carboxypeptidase regulatory-like domain-containing protein [Sediminibacterium soli]NCI46761.1 TonB-dependent receptor [Sediminibacterium soli]